MEWSKRFTRATSMQKKSDTFEIDTDTLTDGTEKKRMCVHVLIPSDALIISTIWRHWQFNIIWHGEHDLYEKTCYHAYNVSSCTSTRVHRPSHLYVQTGCAHHFRFRCWCQVTAYAYIILFPSFFFSRARSFFVVVACAKILLWMLKEMCQLPHRFSIFLTLFAQSEQFLLNTLILFFFFILLYCFSESNLIFLWHILDVVQKKIPVSNFPFLCVCIANVKLEHRTHINLIY